MLSGNYLKTRGHPPSPLEYRDAAYQVSWGGGHSSRFAENVDAAPLIYL